MAAPTSASGAMVPPVNPWTRGGDGDDPRGTAETMEAVLASRACSVSGWARAESRRHR